MNRIAALMAALAVATGWMLIARVLLQIHRTQRLRRVPTWLGALLRIATPLEGVVDATLPRAWRASEERANATAGLPQELPVARWVAARVACGVLALCMALVAVPQSSAAAVLLDTAAFVAGAWWLALWRTRQRDQRDLQVLKELPAYLDILTLCVEAGAALPAAMRIAVEKSPDSPLRRLFQQVLEEIRSGRTRVEALESVAAVHAIESFTALVAALVQAEGQGVSLGRLLRLQAEQRTAERHARAEKLAMQAPVKMLGPLILCIFPCTFIVIAVPVAARLVEVMP